ncbi:M28 family peptidase [Tissierella sp.]|uniref:M28 family peptidase n=1 Tax=Tissierella sp. TaxID=41274 RepID=UPI002858DED4|nr:M28 family peptidase [Tissierella sp.]MDR7856284.1 M28 family peptidase [Tissierella sp.]
MTNYLERVKEEIILNYGVRFFPWQKSKLRAYIKEETNKLGWDSEILKGNIIVGDIERAEYIYTAHYDTPGKIPEYARFVYKLFGNTSIILANLAILMMILLYSTLMVIAANIFGLEHRVDLLASIPYVLLMIGIFIPNKNNYNDNTSGVLTLMNIAHEILELGIDKDKVAFVFFNNEEWGLLGSAAMKKYWKRNRVSLDNKKLINFDCVGAGGTILITHGKKDEFAKEIQEKLQESTGIEVNRYKYKVLPLSDDFTFKNKGAIGIVFSNKSKLGKGYYIPNVHCNKDKYLKLENIEYLTEEICNLIK